jgi:hypothetical protein
VHQGSRSEDKGSNILRVLRWGSTTSSVRRSSTRSLKTHKNPSSNVKRKKNPIKN